MHQDRPRHRILVTGAAGVLGRLACATLQGRPDTSVLALDRVPAPDVTHVDFHAPIDDWSHHFAGATTILHLAGNKSLAISDPTARREIDGLTKRVLAAARAQEVPQVVYASSCEVLGGLQATPGLSGQTPAAPTTPYASAKARMEAFGKAWAEETGQGFLALRIGMVLQADRPDPMARLTPWLGGLWLSHRDWQQAVLRACTQHPGGYDCVALTSRNAGAQWDIAHAATCLGFVPQDGYAPPSRHRRVGYRGLSHLSTLFGRRPLPASNTVAQPPETGVP